MEDMMAHSMKYIPLYAALALSVGAGTAMASGAGGKQPIRTGICAETVNGDLSQNSVFASMCARKWETIGVDAAPAAAKAPVIKARAGTISTSGEQTDISRIATVMQEIRDSKQEGTPVRPLPEIAQEDAPVVAPAPQPVQTAQYEVQVPVIEYVRPVSYQPRPVAQDTSRLSGALQDIRLAKLEDEVEPAKLWFVGVYR
jgi:hypothetical protein